MIIPQLFPNVKCYQKKSLSVHSIRRFIRTHRMLYKDSLEKLSFPSLKNRENPWFYWVFRVFLCTLRDGFLAVFSQISRKFLAVFSQFPKGFEPILNWFGDYLGLFNSLRRHIEAVITRLSWKQFGSESPRGFESLCLRQSLGALCSKAFFWEYHHAVALATTTYHKEFYKSRDYSGLYGF